MKTDKVSNNEIVLVFSDNFKSYSIKEKKKLIAECILKIFCGYSDSAILFQIIVQMKLMSKKGSVLKRGKEYLFDYYHRLKP